MKTKNRKRCARLLSVFLSAVLVAAALPMAASAAKMKGAFFTSGTPAFAYVVTGLSSTEGQNMVKVYQDKNMQSYEEYTGTYTIPQQAYDAEDMRFYTVTEIGGAIGDSIPGAFQNVPLQGVSLPKSLTTIGSKAFAGCTSLTEIAFPTSVSRLAADAFTGTALQKLTLRVSVNTSLSGDMVYTANGRVAPVLLPRRLTDLEVSAPLTVSGALSVPGSTVLSNSGITVQPDAALVLEGPLSGAGVIEVKNNGSLTLQADSSAYSGSIRLTGGSSAFTNLTASPVTVLNAAGRFVTVQPNASVFGSQEETQPEPTPDVPSVLEPQVSANYGGTVTVQENGKVIVISAYEGYRVEEVVINGLPMGSITRYEFEAASKQNTVAVTFAQGQGEIGPQPIQPAVFYDIPTGAPYAEAVVFLANNGIFQGVGKNQFAPNQKASRAMFVSLLKRLGIYGEDFSVTAREKAALPADVAETAWYADAVSWSVNNGILTPDQHGSFRPNQNLTREEAALCLYRFTHLRGYAPFLDAGRYHAYLDSTLLTGESRQAMVWAATNGYLRAKGGILNPAGVLTRAEAAEMLALYLHKN